MVAEDGFENCPSPAPAASRIIATLVRSGVICLEQFEPLYADAKLEGCKAGSVASRMSQAVNYSPAGPQAEGLTLPCCGLHCASRQVLAADVRFGSKADIAECEANVRFTPSNVHVQR